VIKQSLSEPGVCIIAQPPRKGSTLQFLSILEKDGRMTFKKLDPGKFIA